MDKRLTFNEDVYNYDKYRPSYPKELYEAVFHYSKLDSDCRVLEIGVGTGQATVPFLEKGFDVTAVELGKDLSTFVKEKFSRYNNFRVMNDDFIFCNFPENSFDLIYCATAFHWLPEKERYEKVKKLLKPNGVLVLFWNHPFPNRKDDAGNMASKAVYDKYRPADKELEEFCEKDLKKYTDELTEYGFADIESRLFHRIRTLSTNDYIHLINTYSDHRLLDKTTKELFEKDMAKAIDNAGGKINIYDTIDLYMARKC